MIYEKRSTNGTFSSKAVQKEYHLNSFNTQNQTAQNKSSETPRGNTVIFEKINIRRKKRKAKKFTAFLCSALIISVALCFAGKPALTPLINSLREAFGLAFEKDGDFIFSPSFSPVEARTLYTVEYKSGENIEKAPSKQQRNNTETQTDNETASVTTYKSDVYSDGIKYFPITELDLSGNVLSLSNETSFSPDTQNLLEKTPLALQDVKITDLPLVLIIHTHAGECYTTYDSMYPENEPTRNYDGDNILEIGREVKNALSDFGISAIHCENMHDKDSFINAYSNSAKTVKQYLKDYPSIKFVIDIHRDAIIRSDGESIKPVVEIGGEKYAQLMFVVGTNEKGHNHPEWQENLSLALNVMQKTQEYYPGLFRSVNLRDVPFNQQLSCGYLLLEAGSSANLKNEALLSARAFAQGLASVIYGS